MNSETLSGLQAPTEASSGPLRSQFCEKKGSKRREVSNFLDTVRALGYRPELILTMSNKQRARIMDELKQIAERPEISNHEAAEYFQQEAEINNAIAEAFRRAGISGQSPQDVAKNIEKEIPETKVQ